MATLCLPGRDITQGLDTVQLTQQVARSAGELCCAEHGNWLCEQWLVEQYIRLVLQLYEGLPLLLTQYTQTIISALHGAHISYATIPSGSYHGDCGQCHAPEPAS